MARYFTLMVLALFALVAFPDDLRAAPIETFVHSNGKSRVVYDSEFDQMQSVLDVEFEAVRWMRKDLEKTLRQDRQNELEYLQILKDYELALKDLILHLNDLHDGRMRVTFYWFQNQLRVVNQAQEKVLRRSVRILFENFSSAFFQDQWRMRLGEPLLSSNPIWVRAKSHHFADFLEIYQSVIEDQMREVVELKEQERKNSLRGDQSLSDDPLVELDPKLHPLAKHSSTLKSSPPSRFEASLSRTSPSPGSLAPSLFVHPKTTDTPIPGDSISIGHQGSDSYPLNRQSSSTERPCSSLSSVSKPQTHSLIQDLTHTRFQEFMTLGPLWRR